MPLDPATVKTVIEIGIELYQFIDKMGKGSKGNELQPVIDRLDGLRTQISELGQTIHAAVGQAVDVIIDDIRLTEQAKVSGVHQACVDYLKTHADRPHPPVLNDPNYVTARTISSEVWTYFLNHNQLAFMGGFVMAANARIEFITTLDICWWDTNPGFVTEIRQSIDHLNMFIGKARSGIDKTFVLKEKQNFHFENDGEPPFNKPVKVLDSITFTVLDPTGKTLYNKTFGEDQIQAGRKEASGVRAHASKVKQDEVMAPYDQIIAAWNGLVANQATAAVQRVLLGGETVPALTVASPRLATTALTASADPVSVLPLRDTLIDVLGADEFQARHKHGDATAATFVPYWFRKALHRTPTTGEAGALAAVLDLFGRKAFYACLTYSDEYDKRWGDGAPEREAA